MPIEITIEVFGEAAISRKLLRFSERALDAAPAFEKIASMFYASELKQFDSEGSWASGGWVPDAQATINEKMRKGYHTSTLQRTGDMKDSLTVPDARFSKKVIGPDVLILGSDVPYGKYHQEGTTYMPMRKPVELPSQIKNTMVKVLQAWIVGDINTGVEVVV